MHESYVVPPYEKGKCKHRALSIGEAGFRAFDATGTRDVTDTSQAFTQTLAGWILVPQAPPRRMAAVLDPDAL